MFYTFTSKRFDAFTHQRPYGDLPSWARWRMAEAYKGGQWIPDPDCVAD